MKSNMSAIRFAVIFPLAAVLLAGGVAAVLAQGHDPSPQPGKGQSMPQMSKAEQEEMAKMMALATPGEHHKELGRLVGTWKTTIKMWMGTGDPTVTTGSCTYEWLLGGRYLKSTHTGVVAGMPFQGMGIDGYDNAKKQYFSTWFDNFGTGVMMLTGQPTADGKGVTYTGTTFDSMQMKDVNVREEVRWTGDRDYSFTMYMDAPGPDGKSQETKMMEIMAEKE